MIATFKCFWRHPRRDLWMWLGFLGTYLVLTGVTKRGDLPVEPTPDVIADDLAALVDQYR